MKTLNATSTKTLNKMVSMMKNGYVKINNADGDFMAVSVEELFSNDRIKVISLAHYYEQNGDQMADPEMCFIYFIEAKVYAAFTFKQDGIFCTEQSSILLEKGIIRGVRLKEQSEHNKFANFWLKNIKLQQNL